MADLKSSEKVAKLLAKGPRGKRRTYLSDATAKSELDAVFKKLWDDDDQRLEEAKKHAFMSSFPQPHPGSGGFDLKGVYVIIAKTHRCVYRPVNKCRRLWGPTGEDHAYAAVANASGIPIF